VPKGKVGAAVLGNRDTRKYQLLVYVNNTTHLTKANIDPKFAFTVRGSPLSATFTFCYFLLLSAALHFSYSFFPFFSLFFLFFSFFFLDPTQPLCCLL